MDLQDLTQRVLAKPTPTDLLALQSALLALEAGGDSPVVRRLASSTLEILGDFYAYLVELEGKLGAHEFAELASKLDVGAVGGVVLDNILDAGDKVMQHILIGGLSEVLMVLASRQYVKAYNQELKALDALIAWKVRAHWWRFSTIRRPDLPPGERRALIDRLLDPVFNPEVDGQIKPILLGQLFQLLILGYLSALLAGSE